MTYVAINVLAVPPDGGALLEERFATRQGAVDSAPGFVSFELLRPLSGSDDYMVLTRWRSREHFEAWTRSQSFQHGHSSATGRSAQSASSATGSTILTFAVVQQSWAHDENPGEKPRDPGSQSMATPP